MGNGVSTSGASLYTRESILKEVPLLFNELCNTGPGPESKIVVCQDSKSSSIMVEGANIGEVHITEGVSDLDENSIETQTPTLFITPKDGKIVLDFSSHEHEWCFRRH